MTIAFACICRIHRVKLAKVRDARDDKKSRQRKKLNITRIRNVLPIESIFVVTNDYLMAIFDETACVICELISPSRQIVVAQKSIIDKCFIG